MVGKKPATKTARASSKAAQAKDISLDVADTDHEQAHSPDGETKIYEVSFENMTGQSVLFTVEHASRVLLKSSIANMPLPLQSRKPQLRVVTEPAVAHFKSKEWMKLSALAIPGTWHYLANPKEFDRAAKKYAKVDPLVRVFGKKSKLPKNT